MWCARMARCENRGGRRCAVCSGEGERVIHRDYRLTASGGAGRYVAASGRAVGAPWEAARHYSESVARPGARSQAHNSDAEAFHRGRTSTRPSEKGAAGVAQVAAGAVARDPAALRPILAVRHVTIRNKAQTPTSPPPSVAAARGAGGACMCRSSVRVGNSWSHVHVHDTGIGGGGAQVGAQK